MGVSTQAPDVVQVPDDGADGSGQPIGCGLGCASLSASRPASGGDASTPPSSVGVDDEKLSPPQLVQKSDASSTLGHPDRTL
jgi:hypothetical protein